MRSCRAPADTAAAPVYHHVTMVGSANGSAVEIGVLGPLSVSVTTDGMGETPVRIGSAKVRAVLSCLVLAGEHAIPVDRLVRALWGQDPPRTAEHAVQVHVSKLRALVRNAGGDLPLTSTDAGYRLSGPGLRVDAREFERELADGRAALLGGDLHSAARSLERARTRWQGTPYPDLADDVVVDPEAAAERARLSTLRFDADEEWAETCLALGRHQELVPVLEAAIAEEPLRERRYQQLMVALYGAGRTAEALDVYQRARTTLVEQLGIEPGPLLRDAEQAVLSHDPSRFPGPAERTSIVTLRSVGGPGRFVGRLAEWSHLGGVVAAAGAGHGRVVTVSGPPGIGKSRLVGEVASGGGPIVVARGVCPDTGAAPPLWPIVEALRELGPSRLPPTGTGLDDDVLAPMRDTVERRIAPAAAVAALPQDDHGAFRLHDAIADLMTAIARRSPLLLVLDDIHAADAATMGVVVRIAHRVDHEPIVVLATHRDTAADHSDAFTTGSAALARLPGVDHLALGPLADADVDTYLEAAGLDPTILAERVRRRCEGSPLFLTELVGLLLERGGDPSALDHIPDSLAAVLDARLGQLGEARSVIERAAVIGPRFSLDLLARIAGIGTDRLLDALEAAGRLGLVDDLGGGSRRFHHALIAEAAAGGVSAADQAALHLRIAEVIERAGSTDPTLAITEAARHRVAALPSGDPIDAATTCLAAAELSQAALADAETIWFAGAAQRALDLAGSDDAEARARALTLEGEARTMRGEDTRPLLEAAVDHARRAGDPELFGHAVRALSLNRSTAAVAGDPHVVGLLEEAIAGLADVAGTGTWLATQLSVDLAMTLYRTDAHPRPREICEAALERARASGDPISIAFALTGLHQAIWEASTALRRRGLADEAAIAAGSAGFAWHESMAMSFRAADRWELGDVDGAATDAERAVELATTGRRARFLWMARTWQALIALHRGDMAASERLRLEALAAWGPQPNPDAVLCDIGQRLIIATLDAEVAEYLPILRFEASADPEPLFWQSLLALVSSVGAAEGRPSQESIDAIDAVMAAGLDALLPTVTRLPALAFLAEAAARTGHVDAARSVIPELEPFAGHFVVMNVYGGGGLYWGVVDQGLALAAATCGDLDTAHQWQRRTEQLLADTGGTTFLHRAHRLAARHLPTP